MERRVAWCHRPPLPCACCRREIKPSVVYILDKGKIMLLEKRARSSFLGLLFWCTEWAGGVCARLGRVFMPVLSQHAFWPFFPGPPRYIPCFVLCFYITLIGCSSDTTRRPLWGQHRPFCRCGAAHSPRPARLLAFERWPHQHLRVDLPLSRYLTLFSLAACCCVGGFARVQGACLNIGVFLLAAWRGLRGSVCYVAKSTRSNRHSLVLIITLHSSSAQCLTRRLFFYAPALCVYVCLRCGGVRGKTGRGWSWQHPRRPPFYLYPFL